MCDALLPYASTRKLTYAAIDDRKSVVVTCEACKQDFRIVPGDARSLARVNTIWGITSVVTILIGLAAFAASHALCPSLPWLAAAVGLLVGLGPLPFIEARLSRQIGAIKAIRRRGR